MSWSGVGAFVHVAEQRSYRGAARILGITPTAVSRAVSRLEERLGVTLLRRTSRSVALTPEGAIYLRACREALDRLQAGEDQITRAADTVRGQVTVSLPRVLGARVVGRLGRLRARHPELRPRLMVTDREARLAEEDVDVALRIGALPDSALIARKLATTGWITVASPDYLARTGIPGVPADLARHACLRFARPAGGVTDWRFRAPGGEVEVLRTDSALVLDDGELLVEAARAGLGVVQAFDFLVGDALVRGDLVEVLGPYRAQGPPIHALTVGGRQDVPRVRAFLDVALEAFAGPA